MTLKKSKVPFQIHSSEEIQSVFDQSFAKLTQNQDRLFFSKQYVMDLKTAFFEGAANAIEHGKELDSFDCVSGHFFLNESSLGFEVIDHGKGFSLENVPVPDFSSYQDSGRGVFMMKQLADLLAYESDGDENTLRFERFLIGQDANMREIDLLYSLSEAVILSSSEHDIYQLILDQALNVFQVDRASIMVFDEEAKRLKVVASRGLPEDVIDKIAIRSGEGISGYVFQHGRPLLIEDMAANKRGLEKKEGYKSESFMAVPMICRPFQVGERKIGVINLTDRQDGQTFQKKDLKILSTIANQAMAWLSIQDLVEEAKQKETAQQKLEHIRQIQLSYLPDEFPQIEGVDVFGVCEMADSFGGDYFDYFKLGDDLYVVVADVSGHDLSSAMTMLNFRSQLRALLALGGEPNHILEHLNLSLYHDLQRTGHFVSALVMKLDVETGLYQFASAGHYPPITLSQEMITSQNGLVIGIRESESYQNHNGFIKPGDGFLLFTDGVIESMNTDGELYGIDRLKEKLASEKKNSSQDIVNKILKSSYEFRAKDSPKDDITILSLKYG